MFAMLFGRSGGAFRSRLARARTQRQRDVPPVLYHYTTAAGLKGIVEARELWASNVVYLNDSREVQEGFDVVRRAIRSQRQNPSNAFRNDMLSAVADLLNEMFQFADRFYAVSFCAHDDLLSQWRGYGSMGDGYCIGFDTNRLTAFGRQHHPKLRKVFYKQEEQDEIVKEVLTVGYDVVDSLTKQDADVIRHTATEVAIELFEYFSSFKHVAFSEEHEWRLVYMPVASVVTRQLRFNAGTGILKPYIPIKARIGTKLPIVSVRYGPILDPKLASSSIRALLERNGYKVTTGRSRRLLQIGRSTVPLRFLR